MRKEAASWLAGLHQDLRLTARMMRRSPGFAGVAILTVGLGIGASTAVVSVVDAVLVRPLPLRDPGSLMMVWTDNSRDGFPHDEMSMPRFLDTRRLSSTLAAAAAFEERSFVLTGGGDEPEDVLGLAVTADLFRVLGVPAALGRTLLPSEDVPGRDHVAVLSHGLWVRRFGADPGVVGRRLLIDAEPYTVVGVMPASFAFADRRQELWVPLAADAPTRANRNRLFLSVVARLRPGVTRQQATHELDAINRELGREFPDSDSFAGTVLVPLQDETTAPVRGGLLVLTAAVAGVLLVACANLAGLQLARAVARDNEIASRLALGASPGRLVRQLMCESLALAGLGGALGIVLGAWGIRGALRLAPDGMSPIQGVQMEWRAALFAFAACTASGLLAGFYPAARLLRTDLVASLRQRNAGAAAAGHGLRQTLVAVELALAVVLLTGSGLLIHSFVRLGEVNLGFRADHLLAARVALPDAKYAGAAERRQLFAALEERLRATPGVRAVGSIETLLLSSLPNASGSFEIEGRAADTGRVMEPLTHDSVTPDVFRAAGWPIVAGRAFTAADGPDAPPVVIVNATMARTYWPDGSPIGRRIRFTRPGVPLAWATIVGVVGDTARAEPGSHPWLQAFEPEAQVARRSLCLLVRTTGDPLALAGALRRELRRLDPDQPIRWTSTAERLLADRLAPQRFSAVLLGSFAVLALVMAAVGLYGVMSYLVTLRTQEIGVRMAIGARRSDVLALVGGRAALLAGAGALAGLAVAALLARAFSGLLYGVGTLDPLSFLLAPLTLALATAAAAWVPAWRASRIDPTTALRRD